LRALLLERGGAFCELRAKLRGVEFGDRLPGRDRVAWPRR